MARRFPSRLLSLHQSTRRTGNTRKTTCEKSRRTLRPFMRLSRLPKQFFTPPSIRCEIFMSAAPDGRIDRRCVRRAAG